MKMALHHKCGELNSIYRCCLGFVWYGGFYCFVFNRVGNMLFYIYQRLAHTPVEFRGISTRMGAGPSCGFTLWDQEK